MTETAFALFLLTGAGVGILSGLLGVGGGLVIVPALLYLLAEQSFPPQHLMHVALATSLACIIFTGTSSALAHHRHGSLDWTVFRRLAPGVALGTLLGSFLAASMPTAMLKLVFVSFITYVGTQMLLGRRPAPARRLPGAPIVFGVAMGIGGLSSLVGIGGGTMTVPFLLSCNRPMRQAVATAAAVGVPIALAGSLGYVIAGLHAPGLPSYTLGYIYLPALAGITAASMLTAPLGAKLTHTLPVHWLKKIFAVLLYALGAKMLWGML